MPDILENLLRVIAYTYAAVTGALFVFQRSLQYLPTATQPPDITQLFQLSEEFSTTTDDGIELLGWWLPPRRAGRHSDVSILHLHGNAGNRFHRLSWAILIHNSFGCGVALLDYRGYGGNRGTPSEEGLILDARAGISWLIEAKSGARTKLVLHLESLGSAAGLNALELSNYREQSAISGIVVEGGLSSCIDVARDKLKIFPISLLMRDRWDQTCRCASTLDKSIKFLSLHGTNDLIVPLQFGKKLFDSVSCSVKEFVTFLGGGHNDLAWQPQYLNTLDKFYAKLDLVGSVHKY